MKRLSWFPEIPGYQLTLSARVPSPGVSGCADCAILSSQQHQEARTVIIPLTEEETEPSPRLPRQCRGATAPPGVPATPELPALLHSG